MASWGYNFSQYFHFQFSHLASMESTNLPITAQRGLHSPSLCPQKSQKSLTVKGSERPMGVLLSKSDFYFSRQSPQRPFYQTEVQTIKENIQLLSSIRVYPTPSSLSKRDKWQKNCRLESRNRSDISSLCHVLRLIYQSVLDFLQPSRTF